MEQKTDSEERKSEKKENNTKKLPENSDKDAPHFSTDDVCSDCKSVYGQWRKNSWALNYIIILFSTILTSM